MVECVCGLEWESYPMEVAVGRREKLRETEKVHSRDLDVFKFQLVCAFIMRACVYVCVL